MQRAAAMTTRLLSAMPGSLPGPSQSPVTCTTAQHISSSCPPLEAGAYSSSARQSEVPGYSQPAAGRVLQWFMQRLQLTCMPVASQRVLGPRGIRHCRHLNQAELSLPVTAHYSTSAGQPQHARVIPFPKLSHVMNRGKIKKWHKKEGEWVNMYDVLFELTTEELTEEADKVGDYEGVVPMLVEAQEEGYLARILHRESDEAIKVGTPVGLMCEDEDKVPEVADSFHVPTTDVYDSEQPQVKVVTWQSYLAKPGQRDLSCMG